MMAPPFSFQPGMQVTAVGLGRFGGQLAAIRYLAEQGAEILVTDRAHPDSLQESITALADLTQIRFQFGEHRPQDILQADLLLVSPAISATHHCTQLANEHDIPITTEMELFLRFARGHILAVTGTVGKSTTASMLAYLLKAAGRNVYLGGNIGLSLLPRVNQLTDDDWVVLELSSYQLHWLARLQPRFEVSLLTNLFPHHLEWHGNFEAYRESKGVIFKGQNSTDVAVMNEDSLDWFDKQLKARLVIPGMQRVKICPAGWPSTTKQNATLAIEAAIASGVAETVAQEAIKHFKGLEHRQERLPSAGGFHWINDSKATSPWATASAVNAQDRAFWLILGGAENRDDPLVLFEAMKSQTFLKGICWMGPGGLVWKKVWENFCPDERNLSIQVHLCQTLEQSVGWCREQAQRGETILLSPGCPSFNEFVHYEERGKAFRELTEIKV